MDIAIVGSGVVGEATGRGLVAVGQHKVAFVDRAHTRVDYLKRAGFTASTSISFERGAQPIVFVCVPTPANNYGFDMSELVEAVRTVGYAASRAQCSVSVVVRSTVPPGTCDDLVLPLLRSICHASDSISVAANPEFLRELTASEDFERPRAVVVGSRFPDLLKRLEEVYRPFGSSYHAFDSPTEAEFAKLVHNLVNATKISFWNEIYLLGRQLGLGVNKVAHVVSRSAEAVWNDEYGTRAGQPFGGRCLPKDVAGFLAFVQGIGGNAPLAKAVDEINRMVAEGDP